MGPVCPSLHIRPVTLHPLPSFLQRQEELFIRLVKSESPTELPLITDRITELKESRHRVLASFLHALYLFKNQQAQAMPGFPWELATNLILAGLSEPAQVRWKEREDVDLGFEATHQFQLSLSLCY